jgi:exocyst complex protein 7
MDENADKLDKAIRSFESFKELLNKSNGQTKQMTSILSNFDQRLSRLEQTIQPVYKETGNLQTIQQNIVSTLERLDYVIKFYTVANEVEVNITTGPNDSFDNYIKDLDRLKEAIDYFESNNPESPELMNVVRVRIRNTTTSIDTIHVDTF